MSAEAVHIDIVETDRKKASKSYSLWTAGVAARKRVCRFPIIDSGVCVSCDIGSQAAVAAMAAVASGGAAAAARQMPLSAKGKLAVAALRVVVMKESRELEAAMVGIEEEMEGRLNLMFGPEHPKWSQVNLYDYTWLRDWVGVRTLREHLPEIAESFKKQVDDMSQWEKDVRQCQKVMDPKQRLDNGVLRQGMVLSQFLNAVEAAEDMLIQMEQESDY